MLKLYETHTSLCKKNVTNVFKLKNCPVTNILFKRIVECAASEVVIILIARSPRILFLLTLHFKHGVNRRQTN